MLGDLSCRTDFVQTFLNLDAKSCLEDVVATDRKIQTKNAPRKVVGAANTRKYFPDFWPAFLRSKNNDKNNDVKIIQPENPWQHKAESLSANWQD